MMTSWLKSPWASMLPASATRIRRMPKMTRPADPSMPIKSIGNMPIRKTGSSGRSSNVSDRLRMARPIETATDAAKSRPVGPGEANRKDVNGGGRSSAHRHLAADFGAQLVDQLEAPLGLDMPECPAVTGFRALRDRADAVDRADLVAEHDGAVGADQSVMALASVD